MDPGVLNRRNVVNFICFLMDQFGNFDVAVTNALDDPFFIKDDQHRWVFLNDAAVKVLGRSREELLGLTDHDLHPKKQADVFHTHDRYVLETGKTDLNEEEVTWNGEVHYISTKKSLYRDPVEERSYIVVTIRDITRRRALEQIVYSDHIAFGQSFDNLGVSVLVFKATIYGSRFILEYINRMGERFLGVDAEGCIGQEPEHLFADRCDSSLVDILSYVSSTGRPQRAQCDDQEFFLYRVKGNRIIVFHDGDDISIKQEELPPQRSKTPRAPGTGQKRRGESLYDSRARFDRLSELMQRRKLYQDDSLTLYALAIAAGLRRNEVSALIHQWTGGNFFEFVNGFRLEAVKKALCKEENRGFSILDLAMEAGFSNKATFNKYFRRATGKTPGEYRRSHCAGDT